MSDSYEAPLSMGFSRQEYWSGAPLPSPVHESEREVAQSCLTPTRLLRPWDFPGKSTGVGAIASPAKKLQVVKHCHNNNPEERALPLTHSSRSSRASVGHVYITHSIFMG